jgi:Mg-chelatase subunit ChlD
MIPSLDPWVWGPIGLDQPGWLVLLIPVAVGLALAARFGRRRLSVGRWLTATSARLALILTLFLALAGLTWRIPVNALGVVFVVDRSASVSPENAEAGLAFMREALDSRGPEDQVGVVVVGGTAMVEAAPRVDLDLGRIESRPSPHHTDLAAGIRLATAILPADRARRIVVISDGEQTRGDAAAQVVLSASNDLTVATRTLRRETGPEVLVEDLIVPPRVDEGAPYEVRVIARTTRPVDGVLRLWRNEVYLGERPIHLEPGSVEVVPVPQQAETSGLYRYRAVFEPADPSADGIPQNNEAVATISVNGRPRLLVVERNPNEASFLRKALSAENLAVDVRKPSELPPGLSGLRPWAAVFLSDVPAFDLTSRQQEAFEAYVRDLGRGLAMIGGPESFGVGGYYNTPIERALPVDMDLKDKTRFPKLGMVLAIDKSCSMGGGAGSKLGMAIEASILTTELLQDRDLMGVIGFDDAASWVLPLQPLTNKQAAQQTMASVRPGGGTDIYPALKAAIDALDASDAALKHVILLSDGVTMGADFKTLLEGAKARDVTVTTLAFGTDADRATMQDLATWGGGSYYLVTDAKAIPAIFTRETLLASRSFLIEEPFRPVDGDPSDVLKGIGADEIPTLYGYVATEPKAKAVVALKIPSGRPDVKAAPLLAHGRYGLGRSVAFTSDAKARWARSWVGTASYTQTWTQVGRWLSEDAEGQDLQASAEMVEGELVVTVDAFDEDGDFRNFLDGEARIIAPDLTVTSVPMRQVGPGRYQARLPVDQDGAWLAGVALTKDGAIVGKTVVESVQPWSPEYRLGVDGGALMAELSRLGGGGELTDPSKVFERPAVPRSIPVPLWPWLLPFAAAILLLDVGLRRLELGRAAPLRTRNLVGQRSVPVRSERVVRTPAVGLPPLTPDPPAPPPGPVPPPAPPPPPVPVPRKDSYAGRLLEARKRAGTRKEDE